MSDPVIREYFRLLMESQTQRKVERDRVAAETIREAGLTPDEMDRYQASLIAFEERFSRVMQRYPKAFSLIR